jgi:hypothetical protein
MQLFLLEELQQMGVEYVAFDPGAAPTPTKPFRIGVVIDAFRKKCAE